MGARLDLLRKYRGVWKQAWKHRKDMEPPPRADHEIQFLPAALALQEQPVHSAPRYIQIGIILFFLLALIWACVGKIDIVSTATGKIVPSGKSKVIQPSEVAVVKKIYVNDGMEVKAGDPLVDLDSSVTEADVERLGNDLLRARIDMARSSALLEAIDKDTLPDSLSDRQPEVDLQHLREAESWLRGQYLEIQAALEQADTGIAQREADEQAALVLIDKLEKTLPITQKMAHDYKRLAGAVFKHDWLQKERDRLNQEHELRQQKAALLGLISAKKEARVKRNGILAQNRRAMLDLLNDARQKAVSAQQELNKALQRNRLMHPPLRWTAPFNNSPSTRRAAWLPKLSPLWL